MLSTRYSPKCASLRIVKWIARSSAMLAFGKRTARLGRRSAPVCSPVHQPDARTETSDAQTAPGSQRERRDAACGGASDRSRPSARAVRRVRLGVALEDEGVVEVGAVEGTFDDAPVDEQRGRRRDPEARTGFDVLH